MPDEPDARPEGWTLSAPQLVLIAETAFSVTMVVEDRVQEEGHALDYARDRYEVAGPVGQGSPRHLWLADHTGVLVRNPFDEPPAHLTEKAQAAIRAWLDWADDEGG